MLHEEPVGLDGAHETPVKANWWPTGVLSVPGSD